MNFKTIFAFFGIILSMAVSAYVSEDCHRQNDSEESADCFEIHLAIWNLNCTFSTFQTKLIPFHSFGPLFKVKLDDVNIAQKLIKWLRKSHEVIQNILISFDILIQLEISAIRKRLRRRNQSFNDYLIEIDIISLSKMSIVQALYTQLEVSSSFSRI